ncbi:MAG TPA: Shedu anti-phage system protein SduA domain-containing protein [Caulobacteraceae bacterium]|jgi:hypothetical protein
MYLPHELYLLLNDALTDGGAGARAKVAAVARDGDELELIYPAYAAMLTWGDVGINEIIAIALAGTTVKIKSAALTLLAAVAATGRTPNLAFPVSDPRFMQRVNAGLNPLTAQRSARQGLRRLLLAISTDDVLGPVNSAFMFLSIQQPECPEMGEELVAALSSKWFRLSPTVLDKFEQMFDTNAEDEPAFQNFLCRYPQLLDPMAIHVWSQPSFHGALVPDYLIRRADDSYLVVEIETPAKRIMTRGNQLASAAMQAERQVLDYEDFLSERVQEARTHFPGFSRAERLVVIGREGFLNEAQRKGLRRANAVRHGTRIVGFDWLAQRARTVINNIAEGDVTVVEHHRVV